MIGGIHKCGCDWTQYVDQDEWYSELYTLQPFRLVVIARRYIVSNQVEDSCPPGGAKVNKFKVNEFMKFNSQKLLQC